MADPLSEQAAIAELLRREKPRAINFGVDPYVNADENMVGYGARVRAAVPVGKNATLGASTDISGARGRGFSERPKPRGYGVEFEYKF